MREFFSERLGSQGYLNEALWIGNLGKFAIILSFTAALLAALSFFLATNASEERAAGWKKIARVAFGIHGVMVVTIFSLLFIMILGQHFEYHYAWSHSSTKLPLQYIVSCFWEGQEGSFLLWQFWHVVLGIVLIIKAGKWESPVMAVVSFAQVLLASMLLGVFIFSYKIGSNPFLLLRDVMWQAPVFANKGYLALIQDGKINKIQADVGLRQSCNLNIDQIVCRVWPQIQ